MGKPSALRCRRVIGRWGVGLAIGSSTTSDAELDEALDPSALNPGVPVSMAGLLSASSSEDSVSELTGLGLLAKRLFARLTRPLEVLASSLSSKLRFGDRLRRCGARDDMVEGGKDDGARWSLSSETKDVGGDVCPWETAEEEEASREDREDKPGEGDLDDGSGKSSGLAKG